MIDAQQLETEPWSTDLERRLVAAAQKRPQDFFRLYDRYARPVFRYLCSRVGSVEEAEDLTAQTFLEALEALPRYREKGCFAAWLFSIARRKAADFFRHHPHVPLEDVEALPGGADVPGEVARRDEVERLKGLIAGLSEEEQEWVRLHFTAGLTFRELSVVIGRSEEATKKAVYRLLDRLQSRME
jgi:RNA polymerase sigma-70 factor, ECF subfamily